MKLVFKKELMLKRIEEEGRSDMVTSDVVEILDNLDGQEVDKSCWDRVVYDKPVFWVVGKNGKGEYVNENDCEYV